MKTPLRVGLVGAYGSHAQAFSHIINKYTPKNWAELGLLDDMPLDEQVTQARIVKVWDQDPNLAEQLAAKFGIPQPVRRLEAVGEEVEGVIIVDQNGGRKHHLLAHHFLKNRIPVFLDKPLADDAREARVIFDLARTHGGLFMSCSALRFAPEVEPARQTLKALGGISVANCLGPGHPVNYGIHTIEFCLALLGRGVESVWNIGSDSAALTKLAYPGGRPEVCIQIGATINNQYRLTICGVNEWRTVVPTQVGTYGYANMLKHFIGMLASGRPPIAIEETEEIIGVLLASDESLRAGRAVPLKQFWQAHA